MKGFPNQVSDLSKLALALKVIRDLLDQGEDPKDDGVLGEALVRAGVAGTGHVAKSVDEYLAQQKRNSLSNQSHRTTARGLRELFRIMDLVDDRGEQLVLRPAGRLLADTAGKPLAKDSIELWRKVIWRIDHQGGETTSSHPYQVMLRLIASRPGITRAKCALALEAKDDTPTELQRIVALSDEPDETILQTIGQTQTNWNNAKKILPRFAEQLGDVIKREHQFYLSNDPGDKKPQSTSSAERFPDKKEAPNKPRRPRSSSLVSADTIAKLRDIDKFDDVEESELPLVDPKKLARQIAKTKDRLRRHNQIVRELAKVLEQTGAELFEYPFDCFATLESLEILIEVKSLDGTEADEINRVRDALGQLLYYESFVIDPLVSTRDLIKVACFENKISDKHIDWLAKKGILTIWKSGNGFDATPSTRKALSGYFGF